MKFHNKTRRSESIPKKLLREKRYHLLPIYYLLLTSKLAKEGIINGGSYKFADHIYKGMAEGRFLIGTILDWVLLRLKSAQAFRFRYASCKNEIMKIIEENNTNNKLLHILSVPSGYAREFFEIASHLKTKRHRKYSHITWHVLDLDKNLLLHLKNNVNQDSHDIKYWHADALDSKIYKKLGKFDLVISTGFADFLMDHQVVHFYKLVRKVLNKKGRFVTSGMKKHKLSDYLLRNIAELHTSYRNKNQLIKLAKEAGFKMINTYQDPKKMLTMLLAEK